MDNKYPIENEYVKCVVQINGFSGPHPRVLSIRWVRSGQGGVTPTLEEVIENVVEEILRERVEEGSQETVIQVVFEEIEVVVEEEAVRAFYSNKGA